MSKPLNFSWVEPNLLAGLAYPGRVEELQWLRANGIEILLTLTEQPLSKSNINESGIFAIHEPIPDWQAPTIEQLERCLGIIRMANEKRFAVAVHCAAGIGRTGTILAAYLMSKGIPLDDAISQIRKLRPGSVESTAQVALLKEWFLKLEADKKSAI
jgi:atypical dual specificity phosphatase